MLSYLAGFLWQIPFYNYGFYMFFKINIGFLQELRLCNVRKTMDTNLGHVLVRSNYILLRYVDLSINFSLNQKLYEISIIHEIHVFTILHLWNKKNITYFVYKLELLLIINVNYQSDIYFLRKISQYFMKPHY